jgi:hypothetical protein
MKWSGLFSKIRQAYGLAVVSGVVATTCSFGIPRNSVNAADPPEAKQGSFVQPTGKTASSN